jgi:FkbM family methyltransferase
MSLNAILKYLKRTTSAKSKDIDKENRYKQYVYRQRYIICDIIMRGFDDIKLNVVDVGADFFKNRHHWHYFDPSRLTVHVFDVDRRHNTAESEIDQRGVEWAFYPYAVSDKEEPMLVHLPKNPINASCFLPNEELLQFGSYNQEPWTIFPIEKTVELPGIALDIWKNRYNVGTIDLLKMNIQGKELAVLQGGRSVVEDAIAIEIEMSFSQTYLSAPLFSDIDPVLRANNFEFFDLIGPNMCSFKDTPIRFAESRNLQSWAFPRHKLFEGHFLYFRDPFACPKNRQLPTDKLLKLACVAEVYGHVEYSFAILNWLHGARPEFREKILDIVTEAADVYRDVFKGRPGFAH